MSDKTSLKVHLDHLLPKQSLRYSRKSDDTFPRRSVDRADKLQYNEIHEKKNLFSILHKPDFQRETSAWSPEQCVELLESIVNQLIVPSLILWPSETGLVYVLDGAHRISVVRAWMLDDWGDRAPENYYERHERMGEIKQAALEVRSLVKTRIGDFRDFEAAGKKFLDVARSGRSTRAELGAREFERGSFYADTLTGIGFQLQWVGGNYEQAEASFLKINRGGQQLHNLEITLIEHRNSSLARAVMSVANGGSGYFWPIESSVDKTKSVTESLAGKSQRLNEMLFVPPLETPIKDANVPFVVAPGYFQKHAYLLELLPVIEGLNGLEEDIKQRLEKDKDAEPKVILDNGTELLTKSLNTFEHLTGNGPKSLGIVPLFYFYSTTGRYVRSSLYGFIAWLMAGNDNEIRIRKTIFSAHRGRFEQVIFEQDISGAITGRVGSGPRGTAGTADFYDRLLLLLGKNDAPVDAAPFHTELGKILEELTAPRLRRSAKESRQIDTAQRSTVNIKKLFQSAIRCEICGGVINFRSGVQYDHVQRFAEGGATDPNNLRPTHPFCNNQRDAIEGYRRGSSPLALPKFARAQIINEEATQLSLFTDVFFPDSE